MLFCIAWALLCFTLSSNLNNNSNSQNESRTHSQVRTNFSGDPHMGYLTPMLEVRFGARRRARFRMSNWLLKASDLAATAFE